MPSHVDGCMKKRLEAKSVPQTERQVTAGRILEGSFCSEGTVLFAD